MTPLRVMIFSPDAARMERYLLADELYYVLDAVATETNVYASLLKSRPDFALLDDALPGMNALHLLWRLQKTCVAPPKVLYIGRDVKEALDTGADAAAESLPDQKALRTLVRKACASPLSSLARGALKLAAAQTQPMLDALAFPAHLKGTAYLQYALPLLACQPNPAALLGKPLYRLIAEHFQTTPTAAERALRTAVETTWLTGNLSAMADLFGYSISPEKGKPTNNECLAQLARHVHERTQASLLSSR